MTGAPRSERRALRWLILLQPAGFGVAYVLLSFAATPTPVTGLIRPLVIAVIVSVLVAGVLGLLLRNVRAGALLASGVVLAVSAPWVPLLVLLTIGVWVVLVTALRRFRGATARRWVPDLGAAVRLATIFSVLFAIVSAVSALPSVLTGVNVHTSHRGPVAKPPPPDILVLLLDAYPRSDVLAASFGYDNSGFEAGLTELGFDVHEESSSNYTATWATLASMLNGRYLQEMPTLSPFPADQTEQYLALMRAINNSAMPNIARERGYRVAWVESPFENAALTTADERQSGGQITSFEISLLTDSPLLPALLTVAPDFLLDQHRSRIQHALSQLPDLTADDGSPTFAVAHVLSPHAPIAFDAEGRLVDPPPCMPDCSLWAFADDEQWAGFVGQVEHLNEIVLDAMAATVIANPDAVVVVMSDHGSGPPGAPQDALLKSFLAIRHPGTSDFEGDMSPVNLLPVIFNAYLGTDLPMSPYRAWISESEFPLSMRPIP